MHGLILFALIQSQKSTCCKCKDIIFGANKGKNVLSAYFNSMQYDKELYSSFHDMLAKQSILVNKELFQPFVSKIRDIYNTDCITLPICCSVYMSCTGLLSNKVILSTYMKKIMVQLQNYKTHQQLQQWPIFLILTTKLQNSSSETIVCIYWIYQAISK